MANFKQYKPQILMATLSAVLSGCATVTQAPGDAVAENDTICLSQQGDLIDCQSGDAYAEVSRQTEAVPKASEVAPIDIQVMPFRTSHSLEASENTVMLSEYIEQLATDLLVNLTVPMSQTRVGVTTFIEFSPDLSSITLLGNMMAESFIFELQQNGIQVIDYKVEDEIKMAEHGEFIFTRQPSKLTMQHSMDYVLSGTFMYNKRGIEVYARIVEFNTKRVVSSAKRVIPYFVLDGIIPSSEKHHVVYN